MKKFDEYTTSGLSQRSFAGLVSNLFRNQLLDCMAFYLRAHLLPPNEGRSSLLLPRTLVTPVCRRPIPVLLGMGLHAAV